MADARKRITITLRDFDCGQEHENHPLCSLPAPKFPKILSQDERSQTFELATFS